MTWRFSFKSSEKTDHKTTVIDMRNMLGEHDAALYLGLSIDEYRTLIASKRPPRFDVVLPVDLVAARPRGYVLTEYPLAIINSYLEYSAGRSQTYRKVVQPSDYPFGETVSLDIAREYVGAVADSLPRIHRFIPRGARLPDLEEAAWDRDLLVVKSELELLR